MTHKMEGLTARQREIFLLIYEGARDRGYQPSIRELGAAGDIISPNGVMCHIKSLRKKGWLAPPPHQDGRSQRILRRPDGSPFSGFADPPTPNGTPTEEP